MKCDNHATSFLSSKNPHHTNSSFLEHLNFNSLFWDFFFLGGWVMHVFSSQVQISSSRTLTVPPLFQVWGTASWQLQMKNPYRLSQETPLTTFIPCRVSTLPLETSPPLKHMAQSQLQHYTPVKSTIGTTDIRYMSGNAFIMCSQKRRV